MFAGLVLFTGRIYTLGNPHGHTSFQCSFFEKLDCKITQDTGFQLEERYQKYEYFPGFENVRYTCKRVQNKWVIR